MHLFERFHESTINVSECTYSIHPIRPIRPIRPIHPIHPMHSRRLVRVVVLACSTGNLKMKREIKIKLLPVGPGFNRRHSKLVWKKSNCSNNFPAVRSLSASSGLVLVRVPLAAVSFVFRFLRFLRFLSGLAGGS